MYNISKILETWKGGEKMAKLPIPKPDYGYPPCSHETCMGVAGFRGSTFCKFHFTEDIERKIKEREAGVRPLTTEDYLLATMISGMLNANRVCMKCLKRPSTNIIETGVLDPERFATGRETRCGECYEAEKP
jgi:hypothetical protein